MNTTHGVVASVDAVPLGSNLVNPVSIGDLVITVSDVSDFWDGSRLNIDGVVYGYSTINDDAQTLTLTTAATAAVIADEPVLVWDVASGTGAVLTEATVIAEGDDNTGDPIMARIDPGVFPYLPLGPRDIAAGDAEEVTLTDLHEDGTWWVTAITGRASWPTNTFYTDPIVAGTTPLDPLAALIATNGQAFVAAESPVGTLAPSVDPSLIAQGVVWLDLTDAVGAAGNGNYYVYNSGTWEQVTAAATLALCAGLKFSQSPIGNGTLTLYSDPLATYIAAGTAVYPAVVSTNAPSTFLPGGATAFNIGDIAYQTDTGLWFVYKPAGAYTGTWADWLQVTYSATIVLCESLAVASGVATDTLNKAIGQLAIDLSLSNTTAFVQDLSTMIQAAIADTIDQIGLPNNVTGLASVETALDAAPVGTDSIMIVTGQDTVATEILGALANNILIDINSPADAQALFSVTDSGWTGSGTKISGANFLATYLSARG